jgi:calcium-dependent protein kinase
MRTIVGVVAFMLLSSALPFFGKDRESVAKRILANKHSFKLKRWKTVSSQAKNFIKSLLVADPEKRLDAEAALKSVWVDHYLHSGHDGGAAGAVGRALLADTEAMASASMVRYSNYGKLKKLALMVVAHKSSSEEIGILRKLFKKFDSRLCGSISFENFCECMTGVGGGGDNGGDNDNGDGDGPSTKELRVVFDAMVSLSFVSSSF